MVDVGGDMGESSWAMEGLRKITRRVQREKRSIMLADSEYVVNGVYKPLQAAQQRGVV